MILYLLAATTTITTLFMQVQGQCEFKAKQDGLFGNAFILFMRIKMSNFLCNDKIIPSLAHYFMADIKLTE